MKIKLFTKELVAFLALIPIIIFPYQTFTADVSNNKDLVGSQNPSHTNSNNYGPKSFPVNVSFESKEQLTEDELIAITDQFMELLVQETDDSYKVLQFENVDALINEFSSIASKDVVEKYVDVYFEEKSDALYIVPTETPPWFQNDSEYEMIYLDENKVRIIQENQSDYYGDYTLELEMTYEEGWRITNTKHI